MNNLISFKFDNKNSVRTIELDCQIWFVATDVCEAIGHKNPSVALARLDEDEKKLISNSKTPKKSLGVGEQLNIINESGLYSLILRSNKKEAKVFKKWVTSEVLPSIRKTGRYEFARPKLPHYITAEQQGIIHALIAQRFPNGQDRPYAWSMFCNHFKLGKLDRNASRFHSLPASKFEEAITFIQNMPSRPVDKVSYSGREVIDKVQELLTSCEVSNIPIEAITSIVELIKTRWQMKLMQPVFPKTRLLTGNDYAQIVNCLLDAECAIKNIANEVEFVINSQRFAIKSIRKYG